MATRQADYLTTHRAIQALQRGVPLVTVDGADFDLTSLNMLVAHRTSMIQELKRLGEWDNRTAEPRPPTSRTQADAGADLMRAAAKRR